MSDALSGARRRGLDPLKTALWAIAGLLALLWSGLAWASAAVVRWTVDALSTGQAAELGKTAVAFKFPAWLEPFLDTGLLSAIQDLVRWVLELAGQGAPLAGAAVGWLVPVVWGVWGLGLLTLLGIAALLHLALRSLPRIGMPAAS
jgi:hypothetical protein